jgi:hypothetical protein
MPPLKINLEQARLMQMPLKNGYKMNWSLETEVRYGEGHCCASFIGRPTPVNYGIPIE